MKVIRQIVFSTNLYRASLQVGGPAWTRSHCPGTDGAFILESTYILFTYLFNGLIFSTIYFTQISLFPLPPAPSFKAASGMQVSESIGVDQEMNTAVIQHAASGVPGRGEEGTGTSSCLHRVGGTAPCNRGRDCVFLSILGEEGLNSETAA